MKRINNFNDDYFETIDTEDKAYFLGLLFADGNIYTARNRVQITLANEDAYILQAFAIAIGYTGKMYIDREKYSKLILPSKKMCEDLTKLGCTPNKSLTLQFPTKVSDKLMHHFIRGCFDGDGHVSKRGNSFNVNFTSSKDFMIGFIDLLKQLAVYNTSAKKRYANHEKSAYQVYIKSNSSKVFFDYIYKDATVFLVRKKTIVDLPLIKKQVKLCNTCGDKHFAKGFCEKHYRNNYFKLHGK
jgi:hypothetical protein